MDRVPEPELMEEEVQARAYAEADFAEPHDLFVRLFAAAAPRVLPGPILDLGCGPADVTVRLARRYPEAIIHAIDGSAAMLRLGAARIAREGLADRIVLAQARLPGEGPPRAAYPVVVSNSLLHHLHDPQVLWSAVKRFAARGARVFVMDLRRPATPADVDRLVALYAAREPAVLRRDFRASLSAAFTVEEVEAQLATAGLGGMAAEAVSDRHLAVSGAVTDAGPPERTPRMRETPG